MTTSKTFCIGVYNGTDRPLSVDLSLVLLKKFVMQLEPRTEYGLHFFELTCNLLQTEAIINFITLCFVDQFLALGYTISRESNDWGTRLVLTRNGKREFITFKLSEESDL